MATLQVVVAGLCAARARPLVAGVALLLLVMAVGWLEAGQRARGLGSPLLPPARYTDHCLSTRALDLLSCGARVARARVARALARVVAARKGPAADLGAWQAIAVAAAAAAAVAPTVAHATTAALAQERPGARQHLGRVAAPALLCHGNVAVATGPVVAAARAGVGATCQRFTARCPTRWRVAGAWQLVLLLAAGARALEAAWAGWAGARVGSREPCPS